MRRTERETPIEELHAQARAEKEAAAAPPTTPYPEAFAYPAVPVPDGVMVPNATSAQRKLMPMCEGLLDYFPDALAYVSYVSYVGNEKHNPGEPLHHARGKSMDHADCILRHLKDRGKFDGRLRHSGAMAWRALALLQEELEREYGLPVPRNATALPPR